MKKYVIVVGNDMKLNNRIQERLREVGFKGNPPTDSCILNINVEEDRKINYSWYNTDINWYIEKGNYTFITPDFIFSDKVYELDGAVKPEPKVYYKRGDRFKRDNDEYIIASVADDSMCLVCITDGNRYTNPVNVEDHMNISIEEFNKLTAGKSSEFKKIETLGDTKNKKLVNIDKLKEGDVLVFDSFKSHDRSYQGEIIKIKSVNYPFIIVDMISERLKMYRNITLNINDINISWPTEHYLQTKMSKNYHN